MRDLVPTKLSFLKGGVSHTGERQLIVSLSHSQVDKYWCKWETSHFVHFPFTLVFEGLGMRLMPPPHSIEIYRNYKQASLETKLGTIIYFFNYKMSCNTTEKQLLFEKYVPKLKLWSNVVPLLNKNHFKESDNCHVCTWWCKIEDHHVNKNTHRRPWNLK